MPELLQSTTRQFLDRFYSFNDGVLRKVEINYKNDGQRAASVVVATRDSGESKNGGWVFIQFTLLQAQDFCFTESSKTSAQVLSQGLHICWFGEIVGVDFGYFIDPPESLDEIKTSKFFMTGHSLEWEIHPYQD